jgi:energy-coupling factor transporter ATP-binding protein EcfA2
VKYRSFNPDEDVRLSALDAIRHVAQSAGVIAPLQLASVQKSREQNIRAMFVAGLAAALEIPTLIIHPAEFSPPPDVRDFTKKYRHPNDITEAVQAFSLEITDFSQQTRAKKSSGSTVLTRLSVGDPTAENEMTSLADYYLSTDEYKKALRGEVNLVVGRKGSGKTALFVQLRDAKRSKKANIVVDLKPEGFQLVKLKERVLDFLTEGAQQHLITALWEYILLLEITYKVLEKDRELHLRDHRLTAHYTALKELYGDTELSQESDFRERLLKLSDQLIHEFFRRFGSKGQQAAQNSRLNITTNQVTEVLYQHDIRNLYEALIRYLLLKEEVWLLFDNIDKGWDVEGISAEDILILRCLINANRKIEREFKARRIKFYSIVFVRDDVYSLLMQGSSDYGKEMRASALGRQANPRRVQFQLAVHKPEIAVAPMQGVRMRLVAEPDHLDDVFQREIDEAGLAVLRLPQLRLIGLGGILDVIVQVRRDHDEKAFVIKPGVDHSLGKEMFAPELLQRVSSERRGGGIDEEAACVREVVVAWFQFRHGLAHALGIFDLEGDEAVAAREIRVADQRVEGGVVAGEFRIAAAGRMFEKKLRGVSGERWQQLTEIAGSALGYLHPGRQQIEGEGHGREQVCREPLRIDQRANFAIGGLAPGHMADLECEEIAASRARRLGNPAAEFAALAVLPDIAADRQFPVFAPERLEQPGGGPEPRIERFVDTMFFEDGCRDERQLVNGRSEFGGHASHSNGHEANSGDGGRNLQRALGRTLKRLR